MKFSTEAIVALAVAVAFALLSFGAIAREQGGGGLRAVGTMGISRRAMLTRARWQQATTDVLGFY